MTGFQAFYQTLNVCVSAHAHNRLIFTNEVPFKTCSVTTDEFNDGNKVIMEDFGV